MRRHTLPLSALVLGSTLLGAVSPAQAITREEAIVQAKALAYHPWRCTTANQTANCSSAYRSHIPPGDHLGIPYDWGGFTNVFDFDQKISQGYGAGCLPLASPSGLSCTIGLDCSGFVSQCWDIGHHWGTWIIDENTTPISQAQLLSGDVMNEPGVHVVLFSHLLNTGVPVFYEANPPITMRSSWRGWGDLTDFSARRYSGLTGGPAGNPIGTLDNPILISSFPYADSRNTQSSSSDVLNGCGASPATDESGPEYVYSATFNQPGTLTVSVSDDVSADIDVHLYGSRNTRDCTARNDSAFTAPVDCGSYYVVADTYGGSQNAGAYNLTVSFTPSGQPCGSGPPSYDPMGALGKACMPFNYGGDWYYYCSEASGSESCFRSGTENVCTKKCGTINDCGGAFPGGCCQLVGGQGWCIPATWCGGGTGGSAGAPGTGGFPGTGGGIPGTGGAWDGGIISWDGSVGGAAGGGMGGAAGVAAFGGFGGYAGGFQPGGQAGTPNPGIPPEEEEGCGCRIPGAPSENTPWMLAGLLGAVLVYRRREQRY